MTRERVKWLTSLQTFDKVWLGSDPTGPGRVIEVVVRGDGWLSARDSCVGWDLREPYPDGTTIFPIPEAPWGRCPGCKEPFKTAFAARDDLYDGSPILCTHCRSRTRSLVCPSGCRTWAEHEEKIRAIHKLRADEMIGNATQH